MNPNPDSVLDEDQIQLPLDIQAEADAVAKSPEKPKKASPSRTARTSRAKTRPTPDENAESDAAVTKTEPAVESTEKAAPKARKTPVKRKGKTAPAADSAGNEAPADSAVSTEQPETPAKAVKPEPVQAAAPEPASERLADAIGEISRPAPEPPPASEVAAPAQSPQPEERGNPRREHRRDKRTRGRDRDRNRDRSPDSRSQQQPADSENPESTSPEQPQSRGNSQGGHRQDREPRPPKPEQPPYEAAGYFECSPRGFGFLRRKERGFYQTNSDVFVPPDMAREFGLREGLLLEGLARNGSRGPQLVELQKINGAPASEWTNPPEFEELTAINPNKRIILETESNRLTTRVIDMMTPIGRGQRGLIVAPPRTGKTTLLKHIAQAIRDKNPEMHLMIVLIDERPEEVTDFKRSLPEAELFASSNDSDAQSHARVAHFAIERAKRLAESGRHVVILMDSITRLARASNNNIGRKGGKTMSGGIDSKALEFPRRLFAAARCTREAGSLTIIATALIETGSRMDDLIYQEFKGTGNMELVLNRKIAELYIYPAVDIFRSGTRREELLLPAFQLEKIHFLRRGLSGNKPPDAIERLLTLMNRFDTNNQMLVEIKTGSI